MATALSQLTRLRLRYRELFTQVYFTNPFYESISRVLPLKLVIGECHSIPLVISQHWCKKWLLSAIRQQAITWTNIDPVLCRLVTSVRHKYLTLHGHFPAVALHGFLHYRDAIIGATASQITSLNVVISTFIQTQKKKKQSSASLALRGQWPVNSPHKWPVTRKMFPFDDVIMLTRDKNSTIISTDNIMFGTCLTVRWHSAQPS